MKIAISGYGKMGKEIEKIALNKGHSISAKVNAKDDWDQVSASNTDVVIEFSVPEAALENIQHCLDKNIPVVVGTTGWYDHLDDVKAKTEQGGKSLLWASNFSIGVNLFFELNKQLARVMGKYPEYKAHVEETHHVHKKDAPSGTAISIAKGLVDSHPKYTDWKKGKSEEEDKLSVISHRIDEVPGTHNVTYDSEVDEIFIQHTAKSRIGFAAGAVFAAEWLADKKGFFNISDALGVNLS